MALGAASMIGYGPNAGDPAQIGAPSGCGSPSDLGYLCDRYRSQAVGYAFTILRDRATAEDAVQLALTRIVARVAEGDQALLEQDPERVVIRNTRWAALELAKRRRHSESLETAAEVTDAPAATDPEWDRAQARFLCDQIAANLPAHYRDVLRMRYVEQYPDAEGASRLRLSLKAYRCRIDRALRAARLSATSLSIDSLRGLVVAGWYGLARRAARLHTAGRAVSNSEEFTWASSGALHGLLALLLAGGVAVLPLVIGGSGRATVGAPRSAVGWQLGWGVSGTSTASYLAPTAGPGACTGCYPRPNAATVTGEGLPSVLAAPDVASLMTLPITAGTPVGPASVPQLRSVADGALGRGAVQVGSLNSAAPSTAVGGLAPVASPSVPTLPTP